MRLRRTAAALVVVLTIAGCTGKDKALPSTVTATQAGQRADEVVKEAFAQLPAGATLKLNDGRDTMACDDPTKGQVFAERRYLVVPGAAAWPADRAVPALIAFWHQKGYRTHEDSRGKPVPRFVAETPDGYYAIVEAFDRGSKIDVYLSSSSPCVWENGTPDPQ